MPGRRGMTPGAFLEDQPEMGEASAHELSHARNNITYPSVPPLRSTSKHRTKNSGVDEPETFYESMAGALDDQSDNSHHYEEPRQTVELVRPMAIDLDTGKGQFTNEEEFIKFIHDTSEEDLWKYFNEAQEQAKTLYSELQNSGFKYNTLAKKLDDSIRKNIELTQTNRQLQESHSSFFPTRENGTPSSVLGGNKRSAKYPDPELFRGTSSPSFPQWRIAIQAKLDTNADHFQDEKSKITYVYTRTTGQAADQLRPYITTDGRLAFDTVRELLDELAAVYTDPNEMQKARDTYRGLYQHRCTDLQDFHVKFTLNANLAGIPRDMWMYDYYDKLSTKLQLALAPTRHTYTTFTALVNACRTIQNALDVVARTEKRVGNHVGVATPAAAKKNLTIQRTPTVVTVSNDRWGDVPIEFRGKLTDTLRATLMGVGRCFFCRLMGHTLAECPKKKAADLAKTHGVNEVADITQGASEKQGNE